MKSILNKLISRFKEPITYYWWGGLQLLYGLLINPVFKLTNNSNVIGVIFGIIIIICGVGIELMKITVNSIENHLPESIRNIKNKNIKNILGNLYAFYISYRLKDKYLCRFYRKTGSVTLSFENCEEKAKEYMNWYLSTDKDVDPITLKISPKKVTRIMRDDVEEFSYKRVSYIERVLINPVIAFLRQPTTSIVSIKGILGALLISMIVLCIYGYVSLDYSFTGKGSYDTAISIIKGTSNVLTFLVTILAGATIVSAIINLRDSIETYYSNRKIVGRSVGKQLLTVSLMPIAFNILIVPTITYGIDFAQQYGYFLP